MNLIKVLKGVWNKMLGAKTIDSVLHISPLVSAKMQEAMELWESMYMNESPWMSEGVKSLNLAASIASEKARTATIEMDIKITGESEKAKYIEAQFAKVLDSIREQLEYGIALGSLVIKPYVTKGADDNYVIQFNYTKATDFYPLAFSAEGDVTEAAFIDRIITKSHIFSKVEYHKLEGNTLTVRNMAFELESSTVPSGVSVMNCDLGTPIPLANVAAWAALEPMVIIDKVDTLLFAYFKMPQANNVDFTSPLGVSGFSRAVDLIRDADEQYSNLRWEFEGGQLAVDVDRTAINPMIDANGREKYVLPKLQDRLFRRNLDLGDDNMYNVFSPNLRDASLINGLNQILMKIEDVCEISRGTLSEADISEARTATELKILKQRSFAANRDIQKALQNTLESVIKIIDKYCDLYDLVSPGEYEVGYKWDDSIIVDKDAERQVDLLDVNSGLMSKVEYRMKWFGETRAQAEQAVADINKEKLETMKIQQAVVQTTQPQKSAEQVQQDKLKRANESQETTEIKEKDE